MVVGDNMVTIDDVKNSLNENKNITSDNRIVAALPTIKYLMEHGAKVILC